ncbi:GtrA family protein [Paraburkholderia hayleyella]|uniref:GtrA family protein n=1 Tax=Paraburkholderia hayleyella TaxID=2152889 RepID=UPI001291FB53|nr:GtrA family protein [Paraburkholderia hayleyella]
MAPTDTGNDFLQKKKFSNVSFLREIIIASRFGLVGLLSTTVHITIVWLLLVTSSISPIAANTTAFLVAFVISFSGNYLWTFRSPGSPHRAAFRFFIIAVCAFIINTTILAFLVRKNWFPAAFSATISASVVPAISYSLSRLWGFRR